MHGRFSPWSRHTFKSMAKCILLPEKQQPASQGETETRNPITREARLENDGWHSALNGRPRFWHSCEKYILGHGYIIGFKLYKYV
jgi:hypothetical protein